MDEALTIGTWCLTGIGSLYALLGLVDLFRPLSRNRP
jgi:hypothetical protein